MKQLWSKADTLHAIPISFLHWSVLGSWFNSWFIVYIWWQATDPSCSVITTLFVMLQILDWMGCCWGVVLWEMIQTILYRSLMFRLMQLVSPVELLFKEKFRILWSVCLSKYLPLWYTWRIPSYKESEFQSFVESPSLVSY